MAHKKAGGSTALGRDSISKRLGVKRFGGQRVASGEVLVRQRGTKIRPGNNVRRGGDDTLYATTDGAVAFRTLKIRRFNNKLKKTKVIDVIAKELK